MVVEFSKLFFLFVRSISTENGLFGFFVACGFVYQVVKVIHMAKFTSSYDQ